MDQPTFKSTSASEKRGPTELCAWNSCALHVGLGGWMVWRAWGRGILWRGTVESLSRQISQGHHDYVLYS